MHIIVCVRYLSRHGVLCSYSGKVETNRFPKSGRQAVAFGLGVDLGTYRGGEDSKGCTYTDYGGFVWVEN